MTEDGQSRMRLEWREKSGQGWIKSARQVCLNFRQARSAWYSMSLRGIALWVRMRGALILHAFLMISTKSAEMREATKTPWCRLHRWSGGSWPCIYIDSLSCFVRRSWARLMKKIMGSMRPKWSIQLLWMDSHLCIPTYRYPVCQFEVRKDINGIQYICDLLYKSTNEHNIVTVKKGQ